MKKRLMVFPVNKNNAPFIRYCNSKGNYNVVPILNPLQECILEGNDISVLDGGEFADIKLRRGVSKNLDECEIIYFDSCEFISDNDIYVKYIKLANEKKKEILLSSKLKERLQTEAGYYKESLDIIEKDIIYDFDVPIISIFTMGYCCDQSNVELTLREFFTKRGYKISQIGTQACYKYLGFHCMPNFLYSNINGYKKRVMFNNYIHNIIKKEKPDVLILGIPEPIMKYNNKLLFGMGDIPCIIQDSIKSDIGIICTYFNAFTKQYFEELSNFSKYRLNCITDYFNISNTKTVYDEEKEYELNYLTMDTEYIIENVDCVIAQDLGKSLFNSYDKTSLEKAYLNIENELIGNCNAIRGEMK